MDVSNTISSFDRLADYVPFLSTATNGIHILVKKVLEHTNAPIRNTDFYCYHIREKSYLKCIVLLFPILGNICIYIYDRLKSQENNDAPVVPQPVTAPVSAPVVPLIPVDRSVKKEFYTYLTNLFPSVLDPLPKTLSGNEIPIPTGYEADPAKMKVFETIRTMPRKQRSADCPIEHQSKIFTARTPDNTGIGVVTLHPKVDPKDIRKGGIRVLTVSDISGSMSWNENAGINALREGLKKLGSVLGDEDQFLGINYSSGTTIFFDLCYMVRSKLQELYDKVTGLVSDGGGTAIIPAMNFALDCIRYANAVDARYNVFVPTIVLPFSDGGVESSIDKDWANTFAKQHRDKGLDTSSFSVCTFGLGKDANKAPLEAIAKEFRGEYQAADFNNFADKMAQATQTLQSTVFKPIKFMLMTKGSLKITSFSTGSAKKAFEEGDVTVWELEIPALPSNQDRAIHFEYEGTGQLYQFCRGINMISGKEEIFDEAVTLLEPKDLPISNDPKYQYTDYKKALKSILEANTIEGQREALSKCLKKLSAKNWPWLSSLVKLANTIDDPTPRENEGLLKDLQGAVTTKDKMDALYACIKKFSPSTHPWIRELDPVSQLFAVQQQDRFEDAVELLDYLLVTAFHSNTDNDNSKLGLLNYLCREVVSGNFPVVEQHFRDVIREIQRLFPVPQNLLQDGPFTIEIYAPDFMLKSKSQAKKLGFVEVTPQIKAELLNLIPRINLKEVKRVLDGQKKDAQAMAAELEKRFEAIPDLDKLYSSIQAYVAEEINKAKNKIVKEKVPAAVEEALKCSPDLADYSDQILRARAVAMEAEASTGSFLHGTNVLAANYLLGKMSADYTLRPEEIAVTKALMDVGLVANVASMVNSYNLWYVVRPVTLGAESFGITYLSPNESQLSGFDVHHEIYKVLQDGTIVNDNVDSVNKGKIYSNLSAILEDLEKPFVAKKVEKPNRVNEVPVVRKDYNALMKFFRKFKFFQGVHLGLATTSAEESIDLEGWKTRYKPREQKRNKNDVRNMEYPILMIQ